MASIGPGTSGTAREQQALRESMLFGAGFGLLGIGWGLAASSQIILFDGIYAALSILLSWLSLRASRLVAQGASPRYPYGREALAPLVIAVQGMALLGTCLYAIVSSVLTILDGGSGLRRLCHGLRRHHDHGHDRRAAADALLLAELRAGRRRG